MSFRYFALFLISGCSAGPPPGRSVPDGVRNYQAVRSATPPAIDGALRDQVWQRPRGASRSWTSRGATRPAPQWATRFKLAWDKEHLYVALALDEPHLWATITQRDAVIYHDNDIELFIDPDGDGLRYFELEVNALNTVWDLFLLKPYRDGGVGDNSWDISGLRSAVGLEGTLNDPSDRDGGWTLELAIPWQAFSDGGRTRVPPKPGERWRVNFSRVAVGPRRGRWSLCQTTGAEGAAAPGAQLGLVAARRDQHARTGTVGSGDFPMSDLTRRNFVHGVSAAALSVTALPGRFTALRPRFSAWTWVHGGGSTTAAEWRQRYARLSEAGLTGVLVSGGDTMVHTDAAHAAGLVLHRWTWTLNRSGDARVKAEHPEWFSVSRKGESSLTKPPYVGYYQWLCPSRPEVREYLSGVMDEIAAAPGVDAVHLDYIRHPDVILPRNLWETYGLVQDHEMPEYDFCYCTVCREKFRKQSGSDPLKLKDPAANRAWRQFRYDSVTELVGVLSRTVHSRGKAISAAVFPTPTIARTQVRQAWEKWPLDLVFPMLYHTFHRQGIDWIGRGAAEGIAALPASVPLVAGVHLPDLRPAELARAVRVAREAGAAGVAMYDLGGLSDAHLAALKGAMGDG